MLEPTTTDPGSRLRPRAVRDSGMASDAELLAGCRNDEPAAWAEVHHRFHRLVRSIAVAYGLRGDDVDEIVQITFSIFHRNVADLRPDSRLGAWLSTVARRHTWRLVEMRRRERPEQLADDTIVHDQVRTGADLAADAAWLRDALQQLAPRCRLLIEALFLRGDEPSYADIAAELGVPIGSIGPTRARCLDRLRALLEASHPDRAQRPVGVGGGGS